MFYEQAKRLATKPFKRLTGAKLETFAVMVKALCEAAFLVSATAAVIGASGSASTSSLGSTTLS